MLAVVRILQISSIYLLVLFNCQVLFTI